MYGRESLYNLRQNIDCTYQDYLKRREVKLKLEILQNMKTVLLCFAIQSRDIKTRDSKTREIEQKENVLYRLQHSR